MVASCGPGVAGALRPAPWCRRALGRRSLPLSGCAGGSNPPGWVGSTRACSRRAVHRGAKLIGLISRKLFHARPAPRRRSRRSARVLGRLYRPRAEPHVGALPARDAGHLGDAEGGLRRALGGRRARQRQFRHGSRGAPVRHRPALPGDPQRLVQLSLEPDLRDGPDPVDDHGAQGAPHARRGRRRRSRPRRWPRSWRRSASSAPAWCSRRTSRPRPG